MSIRGGGKGFVAGNERRKKAYHSTSGGEFYGLEVILREKRMREEAKDG